ncbi:hypothetical protein [Chryseobacterium indoltheticum]|uniref:Uncharacterized protein n=1 Tax=Chryseobacterium indoltheticum TaxID=254 RepID=A0A381F8M5_9FLAO|nr:hypothetical protein [Chryseobacterium indoltheticum]AZA73209.1 hypothetical protein EG358_05330 [Chryseobacterium indoltheticum]SIR29464.1 hypothetical protein SAMN05421682_116106 [Chryseobacterium indoltheticum]SUX42936.1 Uncharacterised protein [Chryseobacterium indoltheticum]
MKIIGKSFNDSADSTVTVFTGVLDTAQKVNKIIDCIKTHFDANNIDVCLDGFDLVKKINDVSSLFAIATLDLAVSSKMLYNASNNWEKIYVIKNVYLTVFESFKTFGKYRQFLSLLSEKALPHLKENFVNINNSIRVFKKEYKYDVDMKTIRNNISGHISDNVDLYYNTVIKFDGDKTGEMIIEFFKITHDLHNFLTDILEQNHIREKNQQILIMAKEVIPNFNEMLFK